jgi:hypothetical protein
VLVIRRGTPMVRGTDWDERKTGQRSCYELRTIVVLEMSAFKLLGLFSGPGEGHSWKRCR